MTRNICYESSAMAIQCKLCEAELSALEGVRCRKCRQLICKPCLADEQPNPEQGMICRRCYAEEASGTFIDVPPDTEATQASPTSETGATEPGNALILPIWAWAGVGLILAAVFAAIVLAPGWELERLRGDLISAHRETARRAGQELVKLGGSQALTILQTEARKGNLYAIEALGVFGDPAARTILMELEKRESLNEILRLAIEEALRRRDRLYPDETNAIPAAP